MKCLPRTRPNRVREAMREGRHATVLHMTFPSPNLIEMLGMLDFDAVYLDGEHGVFDGHDIEAACRAAEISDLTVLMRVPCNQPWAIGAALDRGVQGIIVPHVETAADVRAAVDACFRPPLGRRSDGGARADRYRVSPPDSGTLSPVNENTLLSIQIESAVAIENLSDILSVGGVDYLTVGRNDLLASYSACLDPADAERRCRDAVGLVRSAARQAGIPMKEEVMRIARIRDFLLEGGRRFLEENSGR